MLLGRVINNVVNSSRVFLVSPVILVLFPLNAKKTHSLLIRTKRASGSLPISRPVVLLMTITYNSCIGTYRVPIEAFLSWNHVSRPTLARIRLHQYLRCLYRGLQWKAAILLLFPSACCGRAAGKKVWLTGTGTRTVSSRDLCDCCNGES